MDHGFLLYSVGCSVVSLFSSPVGSLQSSGLCTLPPCPSCCLAFCLRGPGSPSLAFTAQASAFPGPCCLQVRAVFRRQALGARGAHSTGASLTLGVFGGESWDVSVYTPSAMLLCGLLISHHEVMRNLQSLSTPRVQGSRFHTSTFVFPFSE